MVSYKEALARSKSISDTIASGQVQQSALDSIKLSFVSSRPSNYLYTNFIMMKLYVLCALVALAAAQPAKTDFWKGTSMDTMVDQMKSDCSQKNDEISCMKFKVLNLLDQIFRKDSFKVINTETTMSVQ